MDRVQIDNIDLTPYVRAMAEARRDRLYRIFGPEVGERFSRSGWFDEDEWDGWQRPLELARAWKNR